MAALLAALALTVQGCESKKVPEPASSSAPPEPAPASTRATPASPDAPTAPPAGAAASSGARGATTDAASPAAADGQPDAAELPKGPPRFAWKPPLAVAVDEDIDQEGRRLHFAYHLDVCAGPGGTVLVSHRDVALTQMNGAPTAGQVSTPELKQIEAATSALPTMVIDRSGTFLRGTGYPEMIKRVTASFPGQDFAELRRFLSSGRAPAMLDLTMQQLWQSWVGVWLRFDPARGPAQQATDADAGPNSSRTDMRYGGLTPESHVRLFAHRVPTHDELVKLAGATGSSAPGDETAVLDWSVESDWPDVRPWKVRARRSATTKVKGKEQTAVEDHLYQFNWEPQAAGKAQCGEK